MAAGSPAAYAVKTGLQLTVRIGMHVGPVVAGVIGRKKSIFDLWGDTVNTASRMESHGVPGSLHVTAEAWQHLRHAFQADDRGEIDVKGKGLMRTYLLRRPTAYSVEPSGAESPRSRPPHTTQCRLHPQHAAKAARRIIRFGPVVVNEEMWGLPFGCGVATRLYRTTRRKRCKTGAHAPLFFAFLPILLDFPNRTGKIQGVLHPNQGDRP